MAVNKVYTILCRVQGFYTLLTALWALVDVRSFMEVTGPKTDIWLVKTVAILLIPIAVCFLVGGNLRNEGFVVILMGISSSAGLAFVDFYYTGNGTIKWIYQVDGYLQVVFILVWGYLAIRHKNV